MTLEKTRNQFRSLTDDIKFKRCDMHYNNPELDNSTCSNCFHCNDINCEYCKTNIVWDWVCHTNVIYYTVMAIKDLK